MPNQSAQLDPLITNLDAALKSAHAAQVAALKGLRKLSELAEHRPVGEHWDWELDGSGLEGVPTDGGVLTLKEVGRFLRLSDSVVYELVRTRRLPAMRFGGRIRITRRQLVAFMRGMNADQFEALIHRRAQEEES